MSLMAQFDVYNLLTSKLRHFENDIHFCQDVQYTVTLKKSQTKFLNTRKSLTLQPALHFMDSSITVPDFSCSSQFAVLSLYHMAIDTDRLSYNLIG